MMTAKEGLELVEQLLEPQRLTETQKLIFRRSWEDKAYKDIAKETGHTSDHIKNIGFELWKILSDALDEKVTKQNFSTILQRYRYQQHYNVPASISQHRPVSHTSALRHQDWGEAIDVSRFYGRTDELETLRDWIVHDRCRIVTLLGMGGIGKTALSVKLAEQFQGEFEYVIWRSLRHAPMLNEQLAPCIKVLSHQQIVTLPVTPHEQITCLIEYLRKSRCLLIFDNFETLLQQGKRSGSYREGYDAYGELLWRLGETQHQSCLVITSREKPNEIAALQGDGLPVRTLALSGLDVEAVQNLLSPKGLRGKENETQQLVDYYQGNPLALKIAATAIQDLYAGSISTFFAQGTAVFEGIGSLLAQQFQRLSTPEQQVMYWLAINRETTAFAALQNDLPLLPKAKLTDVLESLRSRSLIETQETGFTQQPVVMEYLTDRLVEQLCQEIITESLQYLLTHALMKAQAKDYIHSTQICLIVQPVLEQLRGTLGSVNQIEHKLGRLITKLRNEVIDPLGYGAGNMLNLLGQLETNLTGYDFSHLNLRQADLRSLNLHQVNFTQSTFQDCAFAATFGGITCVAYSPNGEHFATSDTNGNISIWNANGKQLTDCNGHNSWVWSVAFSPIHPILASGGQDHTIKLWDIATGRCLNTLRGHTSIVTSVAFSPDGQWLASSSTDGTVKLWQLATGNCIQTLIGHHACVWSVAFHPAGQILATAGEDHTIKLWNGLTGDCIETWEGHQHWVKSVAFSPDGSRLVSGGFDQSVKLWDTHTGICLMTVPGHRSVVTSVAFSPDGDRFASGSYDQTVKIWDAQTGQCLDTLEKHTNRVWSVAFHPQGHLLASGADDHTTRIWEMRTGRCIKTLQGHSNTIYAIAHSPHQHLLASAHEDQTLKLWDLNLQKTDRNPTLQPFRVLPGHADRIFSVAFSPDEQWLASASADRTIKLWSPHTGKCLNTLYGHQSWVWAVAFSPNGEWLASASYDHTIKVWDVRSGECLQTLQGYPGSVLAIAFSPDGTSLLSGGYEQTIKQWEIASGTCLRTWQAHENRVWTVAVSPNQQYFATGGDDKTIKLWDMETGKCLQTFKGHTSQVLHLLFTTDSNQVISSSADRTIKVWDVTTGHCHATLAGHQNWVWSLSLSADNQILLSSSQDETIRQWHLATTECWRTLQVARPYEQMLITGATGLTEAETATLIALGARP